MRENRRWTVRGVTYVTLNLPGSCNNLCDTAPDTAEYTARNAANLRWLHETFAYAKEHGSAALMLISQANPGWDLSDATRAPLRDPKMLAQTDGQPDGFVQFLTALRDEVTAFRKPVAYVHGDSHYYRVDKPFLDVSGRRLENFSRIETFGNNPQNGTNDVNWIKVRVDPRSRDVFSFEAMMVPGNRVAVPAPRAVSVAYAVRLQLRCSLTTPDLIAVCARITWATALFDQFLQRTARQYFKSDQHFPRPGAHRPPRCLSSARRAPGAQFQTLSGPWRPAW